MDRVVLDDAILSRLNDFTVQIELCDQGGHTLGYFVPVAEHQRLLYAWAKSQVTDEELEQARSEPGGRSLQEILADLERR